jgi:acyl-CoA thioesterase I
MKTLLLLVCISLAFLTGCSQKQSLQQGRLLIIGDESALASDEVEDLQTWPFLLQRHFDNANLPITVVNASQTKLTLESYIKSLPFSVTGNTPDGVMIILGYHDVMSSAKPPLLLDLESRIAEAVEKTHEVVPNLPIYLCQITIPAVVGLNYSATVPDLYARVANRYPYVTLIKSPYSPAFKASEKVNKGRVFTVKGHEIVAQTVWEYLEPELKKP